MKKRYIIIIIFTIVLSVFIFNNFKVKNVIGLSNEKEENIEELIGETENEEIIEENPIENINILACGDIMFHMPQINSAHRGNGVYDFDSVFEYVKPYIEKADISLTNFETVTAGDNLGFSGFPQFNSPKATLQAIKNAGFDIVSTANNHSLDQGKNGIISTLDKIEEVGLKYIGSSKTQDKTGLIEERNGIELGFLSYTYGLNGLDYLLTREELSYMINLIDEDKIKEDIEDIKDKVDLVVVFIHWGNEYQNEASEFQVSLGHKMVEWGANIIFGSHPHVVQKSEIVEYGGKDNFIIYSMGNFLSNQRLETMGNSYTEDGIMVKINIEKNMDTGETNIKEISYIPTWVNKYMKDNKYVYEILPLEDVINGELELGLNSNSISRLEKSYRDTLERIKMD